MGKYYLVTTYNLKDIWNPAVFFHIIHTKGSDRDSTYQECLLCPEVISYYRFNNQSHIEFIMEQNGCIKCSDGLSFPSTITEDQAGETYDLEFLILQVESYNRTIFTTPESESKSFTVSQCEPGFGVTPGSATVDCNVCPFNQFTLQSSLDPCFSCRDVSADNLLCEGQKDVMVTYNVWASAYQKEEKE